MLFAGWEVRIVKNRDRGQHFRARGHSFPRTDPRQANNMFIFFSCSKLVLQITNGFVYATLSLNRLARRLLTICKKSSQRASNSDTRQRRIKKEMLFFDLSYDSCLYFTR